MTVRSKIPKGVMIGLAIVLSLSGGFWAGRVTLRPPDPQTTAPDTSVVVAVTEQEVGKVLTYNVTATRPKVALASNVLSGVVTRVSASGEYVSGQELYRVNDTSVRVVEGGMPFYRDLSSGVSGTDVAQLKAVLRELKFLSGSTTGRFDWPTNMAVRKWQQKLRMPQTGQVALGELVAAPKLPAKLLVDSTVVREGANLAGGEEIVSSASGTPTFAMVLQADQARMVPLASRLTVHHGKLAWPAVIKGSAQGANDQVVMSLSSPGGGTVCGKACDSLPVASTSYLLTDVAVVKPLSGPAVPVAAITTQADGKTTLLVVDDSGKRAQRTVRVKASQDGVAIVDGVRVGERVQVLADDGASAISQPSAEVSDR